MFDDGCLLENELDIAQNDDTCPYCHQTYRQVCVYYNNDIMPRIQGVLTFNIRSTTISCIGHNFRMRQP
jgi:hypothetical protein